MCIRDRFICGDLENILFQITSLIQPKPFLELEAGNINWKGTQLEQVKSFEYMEEIIASDRHHLLLDKACLLYTSYVHIIKMALPTLHKQTAFQSHLYH